MASTDSFIQVTESAWSSETSNPSSPRVSLTDTAGLNDLLSGENAEDIQAPAIGDATANGAPDGVAPDGSASSSLVQPLADLGSSTTASFPAAPRVTAQPQAEPDPAAGGVPSSSNSGLLTPRVVELEESTANILTETLRASNGPPESEPVDIQNTAEGLVPTIPPDRPILLLHGIGGSFPSVSDFPDWLDHRGYDPEKLELDPLANGYSDLRDSLVQSGYQTGKTLFLANYDWRMTSGPSDGVFDGRIHNPNGIEVTADQITDGEYGYGVDYVGYWISKAALQWAADHAGVLPETVDVIAHSTGGIVIRAYIQSDAYFADNEASVSEAPGEDPSNLYLGKLGNGLLVPNGTKSSAGLPLGVSPGRFTPDGRPITAVLALPLVNDLVTMGAPMRGAAGPYHLRAEDWGSDTSYIALGKVMAAAYVHHLLGQRIEGPGSDDIKGATRLGELTPKQFIARYVPTLAALTSTYTFTQGTDERAAEFKDSAGNLVEFNLSTEANLLVLDLNDGLDVLYQVGQLDSMWSFPYADDPTLFHRPTGFIDSLDGDLTVIYTTFLPTSTVLTQRKGPNGYFGDDSFITPFCNWVGQLPGSNTIWYTNDLNDLGTKLAGKGDGSVPIISAAGLYFNSETKDANNANKDSNPRLHPEPLSEESEKEKLSHTGMLSHPLGIHAALKALNRDSDEYIVTGHGLGGFGAGNILRNYYVDGSSVLREYDCTPRLRNVVPHRISDVAGNVAHLESAPSPVLLTSTQLIAIADSLVAVKNVAINGLGSAVSGLVSNVAFIERTLGNASLELANVLEFTLQTAANAIRALPAGSLIDAVLDVMDQNGLLETGLGVINLDTTYYITVDFSETLASSATLALGTEAASLGITLTSAPLVGILDYINFRTQLVVDLAPAALNTVEIVQYAVRQGLTVDSRGLSGTAQLGTAGSTTITDGYVYLDSVAVQSLNDPTPGDGMISATELAAASPSTISTVRTIGTGRAGLPTSTSDKKIIYATTSTPIGIDPDVVVDSLTFAEIKDRFSDLLDQLAALGDALEDPTVQFALNVPLPFLSDPANNTLDEILTDDKTGFGLDDFFDVVDVLRKYCDEARNLNLADLVDRILDALSQRVGGDADGGFAHGPIRITGGFAVDSAAFNLVFDLAFARVYETELTSEGLGAGINGLGLEMNIPAEARLDFAAQFTLGMNLAPFLNNPTGGISKNDVSIDFNQLAADFTLIAPVINVDITLGFLTASIVNGNATLTSGFDVSVNSGNPMTLAQLESIAATTLVSFTPAPSGTLSALFPLSATVGGVSITQNCSPSITLFDGMLFDLTPPTVTTAQFDCLRDFCNITPTQVLSLLKGLGDWLGQFRDSSTFDLQVPFASGTTFGDLFDFSQAFIDKVYNQMILREIVASGTQTDAASQLGQLSKNTTFTLGLDDLAPVTVTVFASATSGNTGLADLVVDFNDALVIAGLATSVEAAMNDSKQFSLRLKTTATAATLVLNVPDADANSATPNTDPMLTELGFSETQYSKESPNYGGIEDFGDKLSVILAPLDIQLVWDSVAKEIRMQVSFSEHVERNADFQFDANLGLGSLVDASASGTLTFAVDLNASFTLGFDLNARGPPKLTTAPLIPPPSNGVLTASTDFTLKIDDTSYNLTLARDAFNTSLNDLKNDFNALFTVGNGLIDKVVVEVSGNTLVLKVLDSQLGTINSLQLFGAENETIFTEVGFTNGETSRSEVNGLFLENVVLTGTLTLSATDLDAAFRLGVFDLSVSDGFAIGLGSISVALQSPTGSLRFSLDALFDGLGDLGSLLKVVPTLTGSIDVTLPNLTIDPDLFGTLDGALIRLYIPDLHFLTFNPNPYDPAFNNQGLFITLPSLHGLNNFNCLTFLDIVSALDQVADKAEELQIFGFLGKPLPLINLSIGGILDYAANLADLVKGLATGDASTIATLESDLEEFFKVSDPKLITLSVDDYSPAAFSGGTNGKRAKTSFNPSGTKNAIKFESDDAGTTYNGATLLFVDDGRYTGIDGSAKAEWDAVARVLRIYYHSGYTTAQSVVSAVQSEGSVPFSASVDTATEADSGPGTISLTALKFSLHYNLAYGSFLPLDFGLTDLLGFLDPGDPAIGLLGGISSVVQLEGSANINVTASADLLFEIGIDVSNPCAWVPFLYDTTHLSLNAAVRGTDINFTAAIGPLGVFVKNGTITVDRDGDPTTTGTGEDATFGITLKDLDGDGRHYFRDGSDLLQDISVDLAAGASAELPLCFPTLDIPVGTNLDLNGDGHPDNNLVVKIPSLTALFNGGTSFSSLSGGLYEAILIFPGANNDLRITTTDPTIGGMKIKLVERTSGDVRAEVSGDFLLIYVDTLVTTASTVAGLSTAQYTIETYKPTEKSVENDGTGKVCASVSITTPDLASLLTGFNVCDLINNSGILLDGLDVLLGVIEDGLTSEVLSRNLPLVGGGLAKAGNLIGDFREGLLAEIRAKLAEAGGDPILLVKQAIWNVLGKPGLNILLLTNDTAPNSAEDLEIACQVINGETLLLFNLRLSRTIALVDTTGDPIQFDIGIPGLNLKVDANVKVEVGYDLHLYFGISAKDGFFFDTNGLDDLSTVADTELSVFFKVTVPDLSATGEILFLQLQVADEADGKDAFGKSRSTSLFSGTFSVDLLDPSGDGRLTFGEMIGGGFRLGDMFAVTLTATAEVHLDFTVTFGDDARFPRLLVEFDLTWTWDPAKGTGGEDSEGTLDFGFHNIQVDLGSLISKFIKPILAEINTVTAPLQPIVDILTTRLPLFSDLDGGPLTLLDLAENAGFLKPGTRAFIDAVATIIDLAADTTVSATNSVVVNAGSFDLLLDALGNLGRKTTGSDPAAVDLAAATSDTASKNFLQKLEDLGFVFPFLKISELFNLFTGQPVSIVEFDAPELDLTASISFQIPIFPPLFMTFGGSIGAKIDLTFGFDTYGLQKFFSSSDKNVADLAEGFYVKDVDDNGNEITELTLSGGLFAGVELDILIAKAGVTGGIFADILFDLNDPDGDGRVRPSEIIANAKDNPLCIFDVSGRIYVSLDAFLKVNLLIAKIDKEWNFGEIPILDFNIPCPKPVLASFDADGNGNGTATDTETTNGQLLLHMGEYAGFRQHGDTADGNEQFTVRSVTPLVNDAQTVEVSFGGIKQTYIGVKSILVKAGKGNDVVDLTGVAVSATVYGGDGDDVIKSSRGGGVYYGDAGNDTLTSEAASEEFIGVDDIFHGGTGNDTLTAFEGKDQLFGEDGNDVLNGGVGDDTLDGGEGNDTAIGGDDADIIHGGGGTDSLVGGNGADTIDGGDGDDTIDGGNDNDFLTGNAGNDIIDGGSGNDVLVGDEGTIKNLLKVTAISGSGNDTLAGGAGNDTIFGADGNDAIFGGNRTQSGVTTVVTVAFTVVDAQLTVSPDGADFIDGGDGDDVIVADDGHSAQATSFPGAEIGDWVWLDLNSNGIQDVGEPGVGAVRVELHKALDFTLVAFTVTDADGHYSFVGLETGDYYLLVVAPSGMSFTSADSVVTTDDLDNDFLDADVNGQAETETFHLDSAATDSTRDAGLKGATPTISIDDVSVVEGDTGTQSLLFTVTLSSPASDVVTVCYKTGLDSSAASIDANPGIDFKSMDYTLVFAPGTTSLQILISIVSDLKDELNEVFTVTLCDAYLLTTPLTIAKAIGTAIIIDDDEAPVASITDTSVIELDGTDTVNMTFTVTLSNPSYQTITLDYRLLQVTNPDGSPAFDTATVGVDYIDVSGTLTFVEDATTATFTVTIKGDNLDEYDEHLLARIVRNTTTPASGVTVGDDEAVGTIFDDNTATEDISDDDLSPFVNIALETASPVLEGHAGNKPVTLELTLTSVSGRPVTVSWNTQRGTALDAASLTEAADFVYSFENVTFAPGETSHLITAYIIGDTVPESGPQEHFFVNLLSATNGQIGVDSTHPNHAVVKIKDDESGDPGPWYVQFSDANYSVIEGNTATITLVRAGDSSQPVAVYWIDAGTAEPGIAEAGVDYSLALAPDAGGHRGIVRFGPGETIKTFTISTRDNKDSNGDSIYEGNETVLLHLANPTGGAVRGVISDATLTILEDDPLPVITIGDAPGAAHLAYEENPDGTKGELVFTITVTGSTSLDVSVDYTSISGTAIAEDDFTTKSGTHVFSGVIGSASFDVVIKTKKDTLVEYYEDLYVVISNPVNATIGDDPYDSDASGGEDSDDRGFGIILDNDTATVAGRVFFDANGNGFLDGTTDYVYAGIGVTLTNSIDASVYTGSTDLTGTYSILLPLGDYAITLDESGLPEGASATSHVLPLDVSLTDTATTLDFGYEIAATGSVPVGSTGSGSTGSNDTAYGGAGSDTLSGGAGDDWLTGDHWLGPGCSCTGLAYDAILKETLSGLTRTRVYVDPSKLPAPASIAGRVWVDSNADNTSDRADGTSEAGLGSVQINLFDSTWTLIATTYSASDGSYSFGLLTACDYQVQFLPTGGYSFVSKGVGGASKNSDANAVTGLTDAITIIAGQAKVNIDAGIAVLPAGASPWNVSFGNSVYSVRETDGFATIGLLGDGVSLQPVAVYFTADGTALVDSDYLSARGTVRFGSGESLKSFLIPVLTDTNDAEGYETVLLFLKNPTGGDVKGSQPTAILLIFDNPCPSDDTIKGGDGNDTLLGDFGYFEDSGAVVLLGGMGNDTLKGEDGNDTLYGEGGDDTLEGGLGDDTLDGGTENDTYTFNTQFVLGTDALAEAISPFGGTDTLNFSTSGLSLTINLGGTGFAVLNAGATVLTVQYSADVLENIIAGSGNDTLIGNRLNNALSGGAGDDVLEGLGGDDDLDGGLGSDTYLFDADVTLGHDEIFESSNRDRDTIDFGNTISQAVALDLSLTTSQGVAPTLTLTLTTAVTGTFIVHIGGVLHLLNGATIIIPVDESSSAIENLYGGRYAPGSGVQDHLSGNNRDNVLWGREGNDVLDGGSDGYDTFKEDRAGNWNLSSGSLTNATTGELDTFTIDTFDEISLTGDSANNVLDASSFSGVVRLDGGAGLDTLTGGSGTNYLTGGEGIDIINGSLGFDILTEQRDANFTLTNTTLVIGSEIDTFVGTIEQANLIGGDSDNTLDASGFGGTVTLDGGGGNDVLTGTSGDDTLIGGAGDDDLIGGLGNDTYQFTADSPLGVDAVIEDLVGGIDTLGFTSTTTLGVTISLGVSTAQIVNSNLTLILSGELVIENLVGSQQDDSLTGNSLDNVINGNDGNDRITGGLGNDSLDGGSGIDANGNVFTDTLVESRNAASIVLFFTSDTLWFNGVLEDTTTGFESAELTGGAGNNTLDASAFTGPVRLDGGAGNDVLIGGAGADTLIGGAGTDVLDAGYGDDFYVFDTDEALGSETITDNDGIDLLDLSGTTTLAIVVSLNSTVAQSVNSNLTLTINSSTAIENVRAGALDDVLTGNSVNNTLEGGAGDDSLTGVGGDDLLIGGDGNDTYHFTFAIITPLGTDTILEDVTTGGIDTLEFVSFVATGVVIDLGIGHAQVVNAQLSLILIRCHSIENVIGTDKDDTITGNSLNNRSEGRGGNDAIEGRLGDDTYAFVANSTLGSDTITEDPVEDGTDTLDFTGTTSGLGTSADPVRLNVTVLQTVNAFLSLTLSSDAAWENITGGSADDFLTGNALNNILLGGRGNDTLTGLGGDDTLDGGGGNDSVKGGAGNDTYQFGDDADGSDTLTESADSGTDTLNFSTVSLFGVAANLGTVAIQTVSGAFTLTLSGDDRFENLIGGAGADQLTGNGLANIISGGSGDDRINGKGGSDTLSGGSGDDTYTLGSNWGTDQVVELALEGSDTLDLSGVATGLTGSIGATLAITTTDSSGVIHSVAHAGNVVEIVIATGQDDVFDVTPSVSTSFDLRGGSGLDTLIYDGLGTITTQAAKKITSVGLQPVTYGGFDTVILNNVLAPATAGEVSGPAIYGVPDSMRVGSPLQRGEPEVHSTRLFQLSAAVSAGVPGAPFDESFEKIWKFLRTSSRPTSARIPTASPLTGDGRVQGKIA